MVGWLIRIKNVNLNFFSFIKNLNSCILNFVQDGYTFDIVIDDWELYIINAVRFYIKNSGTFDVQTRNPIFGSF